MTFDELPIGAKFCFHRRGLVHTKVSAKAANSDGGQGQVRPELEFIPENEFDEPTDAPAKPTTTEGKARTAPPRGHPAGLDAAG